MRFNCNEEMSVDKNFKFIACASTYNFQSAYKYIYTDCTAPRVSYTVYAMQYKYKN